VQDRLVRTYGTKMANLIHLCLNLSKNKDNRIIIFSQWDRMLHRIGDTLEAVNIPVPLPS
jgi:hypothetical protein